LAALRNSKAPCPETKVNPWLICGYSNVKLDGKVVFEFTSF
jgi:hypothetical protein